ncbi:MAG: 3-phosphoshikimate 1-carboxyvinyltransferase [bacterium]
MNLLVRKCSKSAGAIAVGGDKSITHRSLILGAIGEGRTIIYNYSRAQDCVSTLRCLQMMNVEIAVNKKNIVVNGRGLYGLDEPQDVLDCGNSGTTMRLLSGLLAGQRFFSILTGDESLRKRPMKRIIEPLRQMGARINSRKDGYSPLSINGFQLKGIRYRLPVASAQVKSALMLAGLYANSKTTITEPVLTRDHTERIFRFFGIKFCKSGNDITVFPNQQFRGRTLIIPNDISSASFFIVLGILTAKNGLVLKNTGINPLRNGMIEILKEAGARIEFENHRKTGGEPIADIVVKKSEISPFLISDKMIPRLIDEIPVLAVLATQLNGRSVIKDAQELRVKETDRITAISTELKKLGADIVEIEDGLIINGPTRLKGTVCNSHNDHRIAMALTIAGLIAEGKTIIENAECIRISFPDFVELLKEVCYGRCIQIAD